MSTLKPWAQKTPTFVLVAVYVLLMIPYGVGIGIITAIKDAKDDIPELIEEKRAARKA